ncbi:MAG: hypothetical protein ABSE73_27625, partial [Planctomycetota bacterium]
MDETANSKRLGFQGGFRGHDPDFQTAGNRVMSPEWVHVSKCTAGVPPARGRPAGREDEGGRDARGTLWATHLL